MKQISKKTAPSDEYFGSQQYTRDVKALSQRMGDKTVWGGYTKEGYTKHVTISGDVVSIAVSRKEK